jgi:hypothetical protein
MHPLIVYCFSLCICCLTYSLTRARSLSVFCSSGIIVVVVILIKKGREGGREGGPIARAGGVLYSNVAHICLFGPLS